LPEELGGAGLGYIEYCIIIEELSRVDGSIGIILANAQLLGTAGANDYPVGLPYMQLV
jgi:hypothetical protein